MDEASRIRALKEQGRIDDAQAERLLAALGVPSPDADPERVPPGATSGETPFRSGAGTTDTYPNASVTGAPSSKESRTGGEEAHGSHGTDARDDRAGPKERDGLGSAGATGATAGPARRWASIELFVGTLDVRVEEGLQAPRAESEEGPLEIATDAQGWRITQPARKGEGWIERLVDGAKRVRVRVVLPAAVGVHLDVKAGDVHLRDVPALRGRLSAGDLDAEGLRAVDVSLLAGDLDLRFDPEPGEHRVQMTAGDAEIRLPRHADVTVRARVKVGDASAPPPFETRRSGMSERVSGTLGDGRASLDVELVTGDFDLKVG